MTLQLNEGDRIYKIIEAEAFDNIRKRFISKIDKNKKVTILTYIYNIDNIDNIKEDMTIVDKQMMLLIKEIPEEQFKLVVDLNYSIYPEFKIIYEKDYSDKDVADAIEWMNIEGSIATDVPIKTILDELKRN